MECRTFRFRSDGFRSDGAASRNGGKTTQSALVVIRDTCRLGIIK